MSKSLSKFNKDNIQKLLSNLDDDTQTALQEYIRQSVQELTNPKIEDIWFNHDSSISYWLLMINGVDNKDEAKMASELLFWKEFQAGDDANIRCIQSSDRRINKFCVEHFNVLNPPVLLFSTEPTFKNTIKIDSGLLTELIKDNNKLRKFVSKVDTF